MVYDHVSSIKVKSKLSSTAIRSPFFLFQLILLPTQDSRVSAALRWGPFYQINGEEFYVIKKFKAVLITMFSFDQLF